MIYGKAEKNDRLVKKSKFIRQSKNLIMQGARILRNEAYFSYAAMTKDEVQYSGMTFYEAVKIIKENGGWKIRKRIWMKSGNF
jgi:hypothetical protein